METAMQPDLKLKADLNTLLDYLLRSDRMQEELQGVNQSVVVRARRLLAQISGMEAEQPAWPLHETGPDADEDYASSDDFISELLYTFYKESGGQSTFTDEQGKVWKPVVEVYWVPA